MLVDFILSFLHNRFFLVYPSLLAYTPKDTLQMSLLLFNSVPGADTVSVSVSVSV